MARQKKISEVEKLAEQKRQARHTKVLANQKAYRDRMRKKGLKAYSVWARKPEGKEDAYVPAIVWVLKADLEYHRLDHDCLFAQSATIEPADVNAQYLVIAGDMVKTPETAANPEAFQYGRVKAPELSESTNSREKQPPEAMGNQSPAIENPVARDLQSQSPVTTEKGLPQTPESQSSATGEIDNQLSVIPVASYQNSDSRPSPDVMYFRDNPPVKSFPSPQAPKAFETTRKVVEVREETKVETYAALDVGRIRTPENTEAPMSIETRQEPEFPNAPKKASMSEEEVQAALFPPEFNIR
jgi:hypothetical protein